MRKILKYSLVGAIILIQSLMFEVGADKLAKLRTTKKIVPVNEISAPYFAVQILALKKAPQSSSFFKNIDQANEYECADGYVRYTVGSFSSAAQARAEISRVKGLGYSECFVVDIRSYNLNGSSGTGSGGFRPDGNTVYTIQLAAYRYPVYVSEFEGLDDVMEFYLSDRIYRYTVGEYVGEEAVNELSRVKGEGYPQAHLVPIEKYRPYQIE
ncbi:SPOR domain-containing protein [Marinilabilia sp.]|uniref:SPOR domain-containing protein n=1 Tax=Marinilabilia sp. TaxID=2021252 RepID=UPI0025BF22B5|nr:SPOR domain-containing protein [Marinilabilia sp.]